MILVVQYFKQVKKEQRSLFILVFMIFHATCFFLRELVHAHKKSFKPFLQLANHRQ